MDGLSRVYSVAHTIATLCDNEISAHNGRYVPIDWITYYPRRMIFYHRIPSQHIIVTFRRIQFVCKSQQSAMSTQTFSILFGFGYSLCFRYLFSIGLISDLVRPPLSLPSG